MELKLTSSQMEEVEGITLEYPYVMHCTDYDYMHIQWHWHEELEFNYVLEGELKIITTDQTFLLKKGEGCFVNSNTLSRYEGTNHCIGLSFLFHPIFLSGHYRSIFETKYINPVIQNKKIKILELKGENRRQQIILRKLMELYNINEKEQMEFQTRNILSEVWLLLLEEISELKIEEKKASSINQERLLTMLSFVHENYREKISLEDIANSAAISSRECLRCFQKGIRQTPIEYLLNYRIEAAKKSLKNTNKSIVEIALETGFSNSAYFTKTFRQICGKTPSAYRKG